MKVIRTVINKTTDTVTKSTIRRKFATEAAAVEYIRQFLVANKDRMFAGLVEYKFEIV